MSDKPTGLGEPTEGDMWANLNAMWREVTRLREEMRTLSERVKTLQAAQMRGAIEGLEGEWTVTPPPEWVEEYKWLEQHDHRAGPAT